MIKRQEALRPALRVSRFLEEAAARRRSEKDALRQVFFDPRECEAARLRRDLFIAKLMMFRQNGL